MNADRTFWHPSTRHLTRNTRITLSQGESYEWRTVSVAPFALYTAGIVCSLPGSWLRQISRSCWRSHRLRTNQRRIRPRELVWHAHPCSVDRPHWGRGGAGCADRDTLVADTHPAATRTAIVADRSSGVSVGEARSLDTVQRC